ncbi:MAG: efflux RND transporter permease subunit, partial [Pseudomonadota bacterium]
VLAITAERLKDELALLDSVSFVETQNIPDREMFIEFDRDTLAAYQLTLAEVASIIGANSLELPGGDLDSSALSVPIRTIGRNFDAADFGSIVIRSTASGAQVLLRDIATIRDDFADDDIKQTYAGEPAVTVNVFRVGEEQVLQVAAAVRNYLSDEFRASVPPGVSVSIWQDESEVLQSRLDLLIKNAFTGLLLVVICLALFLDVRLAFLSAVNITIAFAGTFIAMSFLGTSINMMSLFGFILAIGIVVDNAIVISEKIFTNAEGGMPRKDAAVSGVQRVAVPVIFSAVTTIVAFTPLLQMPSPLGDFLIDIPSIVIMVVTLSLLASLLILPNNLASLNFGTDYRSPLAFRPLVWLRNLIDRALQAFIRGPLDAALKFVTRRFLVPIAGVIAAMILTVGLVAHGYVKFEFFPSIDGEFVIANIDLVDGTSLQKTETITEHLRVSALEAADELSQAYNMGGPVVENINIVVGRGAAGGGPFGGAPSNGSSVGNVVVQIIAPEQRVWPTSGFETAWVEKIGDVAGLKSLTVTSSLVDAGKAVSLELSMPDGSDVQPVLADIREKLRAIPGVFGIQDDKSAGRPEYKLALKPEARLYGLTLSDLAQQVRGGFFGIEATRVQRGSDDLKINVRFVDEDREDLSDLLETDIRTSQGTLVPLSAVARIEEGSAPTEVLRRNGRTITTITADVDTAAATAQQVNAILRQELLPDLEARYDGLLIDFGGEQRTQAETGAALGTATALALFVIFALLALIFKSYIQPIVVMIAIPLGLIGAVLGHYIVGVSLGLLSIFGIIGLAGVVINNSLVMLDLYNEKLAEGLDTQTAVIEGTKDRFRPILLTSVTTFLGIFPLIIETSLQAQFLIPLAVSIGFGVLFGTVIIILAVPAFFIAQSRIFFTYKAPQTEERNDRATAKKNADPLNQDNNEPDAEEYDDRAYPYKIAAE